MSAHDVTTHLGCQDDGGEAVAIQGKRD